MMFFLHLGILSHREIYFLPEEKSVSKFGILSASAQFRHSSSSLFKQETTHTFESF